MQTKKSNKSHTFFGVRNRKIFIPPVLSNGVLAPKQHKSAAQQYNELCLKGTLSAKQIAQAQTDHLKQKQSLQSLQPTSVSLDARMREKKLASTF